MRKIKFLGLFTFDRYLISTFLKNFLISLFFFLAIYLFSTILTELPTLLKKAEYNPLITIPNVFRNYYYKIPSFFSTIFPFAYLFSTSFVLGNFYKNNEIIAIISAGWTVRRITWGIVALGMGFSLMLMVLNFNWIPDANYQSSLLEEKLYKEVKVKDVDNIQTYGEGGMLYFARYYNSKSRMFIAFMALKQRDRGDLEIRDLEIPDFNSLSGLSVKDQIQKISENSFKLSLYFPYEWAIRVERMEWNEEQKQWIAYDGFRWEWDEQGKITRMETFDKKVLEIKETPSYFSKETRNISEMSRQEALNYLEKLQKSRQPFKKELVEFYSEKYAKPFSVFILALLASVLGRFFSRKHLLVMTLVFSFVIGAFYFVIINIGVSLGKEGVLPPLPAAFLGNILSVGIYFYLKKYQMT